MIEDKIDNDNSEKVGFVLAIHNAQGKLRCHEGIYMPLLQIPRGKNISIIGGGVIPV